jgi:Meckel syndrome type 1 protein
MELYRRDLGSAELWNDSLERSRKRRVLAGDGRRRVARRKQASTAVTAAMLFSPVAQVAGAKTSSQRSEVAQSSPANRAIASPRTLDVALQAGSTGTRVAQLQQLLAIDADGVFGPRTEQAVRDYQARAGLAVDGIVGQSTWGALLSGTARGAAAKSVIDGRGYQVTVSRASKSEAARAGASGTGDVAKIVLTSGGGASGSAASGGPTSSAQVNAVDTQAPPAATPPAPAPGTGDSVACGSGRIVNPVSGATQTSGFGPRGGRNHDGVDLAAPSGTPVHAAACGVVSELGSQSGYGNIVCIDHGSGFTTCYAHLSGFNTQRGAQVHAGDVIGYVGTTGHSTGPHLHFETRVNGQPRDPAPYLNGSQRAPASGHAKATGGGSAKAAKTRSGGSASGGAASTSSASTSSSKQPAQTQARPAANGGAGQPAPAQQQQSSAAAPAPQQQPGTGEQQAAAAPQQAPAPAAPAQAAPAQAAAAPAAPAQASPAPAVAPAPATPAPAAPVQAAPAPAVAPAAGTPAAQPAAAVAEPAPATSEAAAAGPAPAEAAAPAQAAAAPATAAG